MSTFKSHQRIGRRSLIGATTVEVGVDWTATANDDLSEIDDRKATSITLGFRGNTDFIGAIFGIEAKADSHARLDIEHAEIVRDLLTKAIDSTVTADHLCTCPTTPEMSHMPGCPMSANQEASA